MEDILDVIDSIIAEHRVILRRFSALESVSNDVTAIGAYKQVRDMTFSPEGVQHLPQLQKTLEDANRKLRAHFDREDTALLSAFEQHGDRKLLAAFQTLLAEHEEIRAQLVRAEESASRLRGGSTSQADWEKKTKGMRTAIIETRERLAAHASAEKDLLMRLRGDILGRRG